MASDTVVLSRGVRSQVVTAADNVGTTFSKIFCVTAEAGLSPQGQFQVDAEQFPVTLTADLETAVVGISDAGVDPVFKRFATYDFVANPTIIVDLVAGVLYRWNVKTIVLTAAKKVNIEGVSG